MHFRSPTGVAAVLAGALDYEDGRNNGELSLNPVPTENIVYRSAIKRAYPTPRLQRYPALKPLVGELVNGCCEETTDGNGCYDYGIVA
jgi:hypothetical protein